MGIAERFTTDLKRHLSLRCMNIWCRKYKRLSSISKHGYMESEGHENVNIQGMAMRCWKDTRSFIRDLRALELRDRFFENKESWKFQTTSPAFSPYL